MSTLQTLSIARSTVELVFTLVTSVLVGEFRGDERPKMDEYASVPDPLSRG